jgi:hypothetical protein
MTTAVRARYEAISLEFLPPATLTSRGRIRSQRLKLMREWGIVGPAYQIPVGRHLEIMIHEEGEGIRVNVLLIQGRCTRDPMSKGWVYEGAATQETVHEQDEFWSGDRQVFTIVLEDGWTVRLNAYDSNLV